FHIHTLHHACNHHIKLKGSLPPVGVIYSLSNKELDTIRAYISENVENGFIRPNSSSTGAPVLFVKKKDGGLRLCVYYRKLNAVTRKNKYPVPPMNQILNVLNVSSIFSKIDLRGAYNVLQIKEGDEHLTAFRTKYGSFEYLVVPFGLTNAPASFKNLVNDIVKDPLDVYVVVYLDDIMVFPKSKEEHVTHVSTVLSRLRTNNLFAKALKPQDEPRKGPEDSQLASSKKPQGSSIIPWLCQFLPPFHQELLKEDQFTHQFPVSPSMRNLSFSDSGKHPIAFNSRKLIPAELIYEIHDKELLGKVWALKRWRAFLLSLSSPFEVLTDHSSLQYFISSKKKLWQDPQYKSILQELGKGKSVQDYSLDSSSQLLLFKDQVVVPNDPTIQISILQKHHDSPLAGHPGQEVTLKLVKRDFHWSGMTQFIKDCVSSCQQCSRNKNINHKKFGLLKPLPIPNVPWICLSMAFITQLPLSSSFDSILVIVDRFSKMAVFIPTMSSITSLDLANLFMKDIFSKHGLPSRIVSDRSPLFVSSFWTNLWRDPQFHSVHLTQDNPAGRLSTKFQSVQQDFKRELESAINRFKRYADKSRESQADFNPGDMVLLSSKNIKSTRPTKNLSERWLRTFPIFKKVSTHAYHLNGNPSTQSSISPSWNQSRHQQSQIGIKSLLLQSSLKKKRNGKSLKYSIQSSKEESYGIWWNGKVSVKTQKDPLGNQLKT
ncbi:hypothetical protein O181_075204, partial [Austropuccinia psidii MF-1]|nr:hypothetical protein [Austropuccinia psidii MF-1]